MKSILSTIKSWTKEDRPFAIARVIKTWGSAPRPVGSAMIVSDNMDIAGSVSGGCVEGAVIKAALPIIESGNAQKLAYGVTDEEAWSVGLSCGGKIQVFAERFWAMGEEMEIWTKMEECFDRNEGFVFISKIEDGPGCHWWLNPNGSFIGAENPQLIAEGIRAYNERKNQTVEVDEQHYFIQVFPRKSQLLIIGAAHITVDLIDLAHKYDFETIVIDPRGFFVDNTHFIQEPDQLIAKYPSEVLHQFKLDAYTYAVVLSHDPKIDDNALQVLLNSEIGYIGALGSKRTHAKRIDRLKGAGHSVNQIERIHAPIGVGINAKTPKEIALSIIGEIIKVKNAY